MFSQVHTDTVANIIAGTMQLKNRKSKAKEPYDIWDGIDGPKKSKIKAKSMHPSKKRSKQIALPHPGQSYNPDPEDHDRLLKRIAEKELEYQKTQAAINRALGKGKRVDSDSLVTHEEDEMLSGIRHLIKGKDRPADLSGDETESVYSEYDEKDFEVILKDKKVQEKRKTRRQRLGQLRDKLQRKAAKLRKLKNIRLSKFDSIKKISKELDKKEKEAIANHTKRHRRTKNERLGPKFTPSDPIYCLKSELPSSLRDVSCPMNAIVREQLESFQSRLLVEPTHLQKKRRKYKKIQYERKSAEERER